MDIDDVKVRSVHSIPKYRIQDLTEYRPYQDEDKGELNISEVEKDERRDYKCTCTNDEKTGF